MSISGLVITLAEEPQQRDATLRALATHAGIELGATIENRVAAVAETNDRNEDAALWDWLHALPGVQFVDVAYVHFDEDEPRAAVENRGQGEGGVGP